jgi:hypothetical protein
MPKKVARTKGDQVVAFASVAGALEYRPICIIRFPAFKMPVSFSTFWAALCAIFLVIDKSMEPGLSKLSESKDQSESKSESEDDDKYSSLEYRFPPLIN